MGLFLFFLVLQQRNGGRQGRAVLKSKVPALSLRATGTTFATGLAGEEIISLANPILDTTVLR
jgi:hypothetical protein